MIVDGTIIGLGAASLGNLSRPLGDDACHELLEAAWEAGIRHFDTAPHYGLGLSERRLGAFLRSKPRSEYTISTKVGRLLEPNPDYVEGELDLAEGFAVPAAFRRRWDFTEQGVVDSLEASLERLGLDRVDTLYLHDPERGGHLDVALAEGLPALAALRSKGIVAEIGVGSMTTSALAAVAATGLADDVMVAGRYTLAEQTVLDEVWPAIERSNGRVTCASVFNSGLLATTSADARGRYDYGEAPAEVVDHVAAIRRVCDRHGVPLPAAALRFPLRDPLVARLVLGTGRVDQLRQNLAWLTGPVPEELWSDLRDAELIPR